MSNSSSVVDADFDDDIEQHRREITGYCYRMLGSVFEADDAAQETMIRAWRSQAGFEGRSSLRTWLYRIATNVCLDAVRGQKRRARPMDLGPASPAEGRFLGPMRTDQAWVLPMPDARSLPNDGPEALALERESIRLAFVAALQHLPARQRAVLILCQVLRWPATEVAQLLETSVASVNSALQRARATLEARDPEASPIPDALGEGERDLLEHFVDAFERYDMSRLALLLRDDVVQSMPPFDLWIQGRDDIARWMLGPGKDCEGSRLIPTAANGCAAFGQYRKAESFDNVDPSMLAGTKFEGFGSANCPGGHLPWALQVVEITGGGISAIHSFLDPDLFVAFGLPTRLEPEKQIAHR